MREFGINVKIKFNELKMYVGKDKCQHILSAHLDQTEISDVLFSLKLQMFVSLNSSLEEPDSNHTAWTVFVIIVVWNSPNTGRYLWLPQQPTSCLLSPHEQTILFSSWRPRWSLPGPIDLFVLEYMYGAKV